MTCMRIVFNCCWTTLCITGFLFHIFNTCQIYFSYKTVTRVQQIIEDEIHLKSPQLAICVGYWNFINRTRLKEEEGISFPFVHEMKDDFDLWINATSLLTIRHVFEYTPDAKDSIKECLVRNRTLPYVTTIVEGPNCVDFFKVDKFYMQTYICYRFQPKRNAPISFERVTQSLLFPSLFFSVSLTPVFNSSVNLLPIVFYDNLPYNSRRFSYPIARLTSQRKSNSFDLMYNWIEVNLKPPPYDNDCRLSTTAETYQLLTRCLVEKFAKIHRAPFTEILTEPMDLKHINYYDLIDEEKAQKIKKIEKSCKKSYGKMPCKYHFMTTRAEEFVDPRSGLHFNVRTPASPVTLLKSEEKTSLNDFLILVASCFGIWLGVSVLSLNPFIKWISVSSKVQRYHCPCCYRHRIMIKRLSNSRSRFTTSMSL